MQEGTARSKICPVLHSNGESMMNCVGSNCMAWQQETGIEHEGWCAILGGG